MRSLLTLIKIIALVLIIQACSKRVVDLEKSSAAFNLRLTTDSSSKVHLKTVFYQTSKSFRFTTDEYEFEIIPEGEFTFGPEQGFKGKAKSVKGKSKKTVQENNQVAISLKKDSTASVNSGKILDQKSKGSSYSKNSTKIPAKFPAAGLFALMIIALIGVPAFVFLKPYIIILWNRLHSR